MAAHVDDSGDDDDGAAVSGHRLPNDLEFQFGMTLAVGQVDMRYAIQYHDYRRADVTTKVKIR